MNSIRTKRIEGLLQKEIAEILRKYFFEHNKGTLISVSKVKITPDLSIARFYLSIFPTNKTEEIIKEIKQKTSLFRGNLGNIVKNQLRKIPEIEFFVDDSLDYIEKIEKELKGEGNNPIK